MEGSISHFVEPYDLNFQKLKFAIHLKLEGCFCTLLLKLLR